MTVHRTLAFLLIALQAAALGHLTHTLVFPLGVSAVALLGVFSRTRFRWSRDQKRVATAAVVLLFYMKYAVAPHELRLHTVYIQSHLALVVGQALMVLQTAQFFLHRDDDRLPLWLPGLGALALVSVLDLRVSTAERFVTQALTAAFTGTAALYFGSCRKPLPEVPRAGRWSRAAANGVVLVLVAATGWVAASALYRNERRIEEWIADIISPWVRTRSSLGFSRRARLGSINSRKSAAADHISLRVYAKSPPGYLRGCVFDGYGNGEWFAGAGRKPFFPIDRLPPGIRTPPEGQQTFRIDYGKPPKRRVLEVWPDVDLEGAILTPLSATHLQALLEKVDVNVHRIVESDEMLAGYSYTTYAPAGKTPQGPPRPIATNLRLKTTQDLTNGHPRVRALADRVFAGCRTTAEKIAAVQDYFQAHYEYHLGISVPPGVEDPLIWFLLERPAAHCEYFASGTVALLRLKNVPCRYVTGFVAAEWNGFGDYWIARNKDAHAWVEAYDEQRGWVIVESTPAAGQPVPYITPTAWQFWENVRGAFGMFRVQLQQGGLKWFAQKLYALTVSVQGLIVAAGVIGIGLLLRLRESLARPREKLTPALRALHRLLRRMDARLRKHDLQRRTGETLDQFANRIVADRGDDEQCRQAARWYRFYASLRYGEKIDEQTRNRLARAMQTP